MEQSISCNDCSLTFANELTLESHLQICPFQWPKTCTACCLPVNDVTSLLNHLDSAHNLKIVNSGKLTNGMIIGDNSSLEDKQNPTLLWLNDQPKTPVVRSACCLDLGENCMSEGGMCDQIAFCPRIFGEVKESPIKDQQVNETCSPGDQEASVSNIVVLDSQLATLDFDEELGEIKDHQEVENSTTKLGNDRTGKMRNKKNSGKGFPCDQCEKEFNQKIHLKKHMITAHGGKRPFQCTQCKYSSVDSGHMKVHMRKHTGEKPYLCHICCFKAAQNSTLRQHCAIKHPNTTFHCLWCRLEFFTTYEFERHSKSCNKSREVDRDSPESSSFELRPNTRNRSSNQKLST